MSGKDVERIVCMDYTGQMNIDQGTGTWVAEIIDGLGQTHLSCSCSCNTYPEVMGYDCDMWFKTPNILADFVAGERRQ